jgi:NADP-dependent 3-hydroxy acid dehydrogenase YdfG
VTTIEPGYVETELQSHNVHPLAVKGLEKMREKIDPLQSEDIADAISWAVTRPEHVSVNEILIRPTKQSG